MLQFADLKTQGLSLQEQFETLWGRLDSAESRERLLEIEAQLSKPGAWDKPELLTPVLREKSALEFKLGMFRDLEQAKTNVDEWLLLAQEDQGQDALEALNENLALLQKRLDDTELATLLNGPDDNTPAILEIHPGAGGVDAQDWAEMLLRMYLRWAESRGFQVVELDRLYGDEAGIKSVTLQITGPYAYGLLKGEAGIHRLIRISPFDASGRRHTAFASVDAYPDIDTNIEIDVREEDLRIDVFRASGPGGQHVNRTNSAVRITHLPSNIVVQCQNEKSQLKNKILAMKVLKARLYEREIKELEASKKADYASKDAIAFGSQIRTYTLQPYRLVKDHRCGHEDSSVDAVLDGRLDEFLRATLLHVHGGKKSGHGG
ncbi:MAG: peptide chain release factor 2 [Humidesulfovibrio sp.]|uniref:peptide chain release factor 2 n=1 Tax=Humidesulfovibrio sp. TaxID=2910988 RepID=UPI002736B7A5|nr:peptide chain release factor 2 [Humidesulfovibrio sp.]MDP2847995.1 peptide chain release factor 2 [Humidesulfovibrio sp.]